MDCSEYKYRRLYLRIVGGVALIVLLSLLGTWLLITATSYFFSFVCLIFILLITLFIIRLMNGLNGRISLFFESLHNRDFTLRYSEVSEDPFLRELHGEMNRIFSLFSESRKEMEENQVYYESILRVLTHEVRNSITPIRSLSADLCKYAATYTPAQLQEDLEVIHGQAKSLSAFLDSYHRLTHLPEPERKKILISSLFEKLACLLRAEPDSERIRFHAPDDLSFSADLTLIVLVLINLIRNALQAIVRRSDGRVQVAAVHAPDGIQLTVTDNGPGIPPDLLPVVCTPFFTTKPGGTGIGLSLSLRIMRLHGGDLRVDSIPEIRTVFTLVFPH